jgi:pyruvate,orthophosphate dikinase
MATKKKARKAASRTKKAARKAAGTAAVKAGRKARRKAGRKAARKPAARRVSTRSTRKPARPAARGSRYVYSFGGGRADGKADMKALLGGKGANLAEMARLGLPVPPGFTISTEVCTHYYAHGHRYPAALQAQVNDALAKMERAIGKRFGDPADPLLVSVRSGARASMPGMMDTILNLGLNDETVQGVIATTGNERFAWDSYRRFVQMYGDVVLGLKPESKTDEDPFEIALEEKKRSRRVHLDTDLDAEALRELVHEFKALIRMRRHVDFPEDPREQLWGAIGAVFGSWMNDRAVVYRKLNDIPASWGTAVNVQSMVFGNMGTDSGTGVAFTRDPASGENLFYGEFLMNAQGEDVVAGTRTPLPIADLARENPTVYGQLEKVRRTLEKHYRDVLDIEFTIQQGTLWMLQCRVGKRTATAAVKIAVDMVREKLIDSKEALRRIEPETLNQLLRPVFDPRAKGDAASGGRLLAKGLNAGPGAATGKIALNAEDAATLGARGERVILVRHETSPEDIRGMAASEGILTARGGMTSHAALVGRQMGKVCVVGCDALQIDYGAGTVRIAGKDQVLREGDPISIDGFTGEIFAGEIRTVPSEVVAVLIDRTVAPDDAPVYRTYAQIMQWADQHRKLGIRANADLPEQCEHARAFGAEGVGLCRTEHMFFGEGKIGPMRRMILAETTEERRAALAELLPLQRADFAGIFRTLGGKPVTIRLIDPPLHEFVPHDEAGQRELASELGMTYEHVHARVEALHEFNPMLGFRGCRLGIIHPEITEMQATAIFEAAVDVIAAGTPVLPEIMVPLVGTEKELRLQRELVERVAEDVMKRRGSRFRYLVGTMIEVPRGALMADRIATAADFFSFGTNDLTQTTLGVSRDDAGRFLVPYVGDLEIYARDPFESIDRDGVGRLMAMAVDGGRRGNAKIKLGICGEHGGDPSSIALCAELGLDYVSCSPFRLPIARLAAARAALG